MASRARGHGRRGGARLRYEDAGLHVEELRFELQLAGGLRGPDEGEGPLTACSKKRGEDKASFSCAAIALMHTSERVCTTALRIAVPSDGLQLQWCTHPTGCAHQRSALQSFQGVGIEVMLWVKYTFMLCTAVAGWRHASVKRLNRSVKMRPCVIFLTKSSSHDCLLMAFRQLMEALTFAKTRRARASPKRLNQRSGRKSTAHTQKRKHCEICRTLTGCSVHWSGLIPGAKSHWILWPVEEAGRL